MNPPVFRTNYPCGWMKPTFCFSQRVIFRSKFEVLSSNLKANIRYLAANCVYLKLELVSNEYDQKLKSSFQDVVQLLTVMDARILNDTTSIIQLNIVGLIAYMIFLYF